MKRYITSILVFALAALLAAGCSGNAPQAASPSPSATPTLTPSPSFEATPTPDLPSADPALTPFSQVLQLPKDEWPDACRVAFEHSSGVQVETRAELARGEDFSLYLLTGLNEKSFDRFILEENRILPSRQQMLDTGEGITVYGSFASADDALGAMIADSEERGYFITARHDLGETWNEMYGFSLDPSLGAIAYPGEFVVMEHDEGSVRRLLAMKVAAGYRLAVVQTYEPEAAVLAEPQMFRYLCAMLAGLRFEG